MKTATPNPFLVPRKVSVNITSCLSFHGSPLKYRADPLPNEIQACPEEKEPIGVRIFDLKKISNIHLKLNLVNKILLYQIETLFRDLDEKFNRKQVS